MTPTDANANLRVIPRYLKELRLQAESLNNMNTTKRAGEELGADGQPTGKRPRGRPKGSKTRVKTAHKAAAADASTGGAGGAVEGAHATPT